MPHASVSRVSREIVHGARKPVRHAARVDVSALIRTADAPCMLPMMRKPKRRLALPDVGGGELPHTLLSSRASGAQRQRRGTCCPVHLARQAHWSCHLNPSWFGRYAVYILASLSRALYVGVTNDLSRRLFEHKRHLNPRSHTAHYRITRLVHVEAFDDVRAAIAREKQIKSWRREKKVRLIESLNAGWHDLGLDLLPPDAP
jgi:putative endonuclease